MNRKPRLTLNVLLLMASCTPSLKHIQPTQLVGSQVDIERKLKKVPLTNLHIYEIQEEGRWRGFYVEHLTSSGCKEYATEASLLDGNCTDGVQNLPAGCVAKRLTELPKTGAGFDEYLENPLELEPPIQPIPE